MARIDDGVYLKYGDPVVVRVIQSALDAFHGRDPASIERFNAAMAANSLPYRVVSLDTHTLVIALEVDANGIPSAESATKE